MRASSSTNRRVKVACACMALLFACTARPTSTEVSPPTSAGGSSPVEAHAPPSSSAGDPSCPVGVLDLRIARHEGHPIRAFVDVTMDDERALFLFDTGDAVTHLTHSLGNPRVIPRAGRVRLGCQTRSRLLDSRPFVALGHSEGLEVIGILGADAIGPGLTELDLRDQKLRLHDALPSDAAAWPTVPLELVEGVMLTRATVDGRSVRLLVDTGTDTLLLLTDNPGPGQVVKTTDAGGRPLELVWGTALLRWAAPDASSVPTWRTRA